MQEQRRDAFHWLSVPCAAVPLVRAFSPPLQSRSLLFFQFASLKLVLGIQSIGMSI